MQIAVAAAPPFFKNGYIVSCETTQEAIYIDPGEEVDELIAYAQEKQLNVKLILLTHAHLDHITGVDRAKAAFNVPIWLHRDDSALYENVVEQGRMFGLDVKKQPPVDKFYDEGQTFSFGDYAIEVTHTPGHCPGNVCLSIGRTGNSERVLFVGDTLFAGSIGRTDLPGGDHPLLIRSIREKLFVYPDDTVVHSGHGPETTIGEEKSSNPFLR